MISWTTGWRDWFQGWQTGGPLWRSASEGAGARLEGVEEPDDPPSTCEDGTDLTLIRWALDLSPIERLRAFEALMADVVKMLDAAHPT